jgi:hypothetical protein
MGDWTVTPAAGDYTFTATLGASQAITAKVQIEPGQRVLLETQVKLTP